MTSFDYLANQLARLDARDQLRRLVPRRHDGIFWIDENGRRLINFGSNDYLGLAASKTVDAVATGAGASALVSGWTVEHEALATRIAEFESTEAAVLFPSGYAACSGTVAALAGANDVIFSDQFNHASLIDGCRLSRAKCIVYPHRNTDFLTKSLTECRHLFERVWIVTDAVFSMDGNIAPLVELCDISDRFDAALIVDEAHGTGVLGTTGGGLCEALEVKERVPIRIGTLSKAVGTQGGFVAAPRVVIDFLVNRCRPLIFSTSLAPAAVRAADQAIKSFPYQRDIRERVQGHAKRVRRSMSLLTDCEIENGIPIVPYILGDEAATIAASKRLAEAGLYVPAIRPPTVPIGTSRLRISLSAAHDDTMINTLLNALTS